MSDLIDEFILKVDKMKIGVSEEEISALSPV